MSFNLFFSPPRLKPRRSQIAVEASPGEGWSKQKQQKAFGQTGQYELADFLKVKVCVYTCLISMIYSTFISMINN